MVVVVAHVFCTVVGGSPVLLLMKIGVQFTRFLKKKTILDLTA